MIDESIFDLEHKPLDVVFDPEPSRRSSVHPPSCVVNEQGDAIACLPRCPVSFPDDVYADQVEEILESARASIPPPFEDERPTDPKSSVV